MVWTLGIDFKKTSCPGPIVGCPNDWNSTDWGKFCDAMSVYITSEGTTLGDTQVPLVQGVAPDISTCSPNAQWNLGPTDWVCFNIPPLFEGDEGAVAYGFMVSGNELPKTAESDFRGAALFPDTQVGSNALLFISSDLTIGAFEILCTGTAMRQLALIGVYTLVQFNIPQLAWTSHIDDGSEIAVSTYSRTPWNFGPYIGAYTHRVRTLDYST